MAKKETILKVLIASPEDVNNEKQVLIKIIDEINRIWSRDKSIRLEPLTWENHTYPDIGDDAQDVINKQLGDDYDIFVGIFWTRFGTKTKRAGSGTEEEFYRSYEIYKNNKNKIKIMLFFKTKGPENLINFDIEQYKLLSDFKVKVEKLGVYYKNFDSIDKFKEIVRNGLENQLLSYGKEWGELIIVNNDNVKKEIEIDNEYFSEDDGFIDIIETGMSESKKLTKSILSFNEALIEMKMVYKAVGKSTSKNSINEIADGMYTLMEKTEEKIPEIEESSRIYLNSLKHASIFIKELKGDCFDQIEAVQQVIITMKNSIKMPIPMIDRFVNMILKQPRLTTKFNHAKKQLAVSLNKLKDLLNSTDKYSNEINEFLIEINIKKTDEFTTINSERDLKYKVRDAVKNADLHYYDINHYFPKGKYISEIKNKNNNIFHIYIEYWNEKRGKYFPSEQVEKLFKMVSESKFPIILATNALRLTNTGREILEEFNSKYKKNKLYIISGQTRDAFIEKINKI